MITTLNKIRAHDLCTDGWKKLLQHLGKTEADDEPLSIITILDSNGLDDALWSLCAVEGCEREMRLFSVFCARQVQHLMTDQRSIDALYIAERFANGDATSKQLKAAEDAAMDAAIDSAWAAAVATCADAACDAASAAAGWAAWDAAWDAARAAASWAAWDAARAAQEAELRRVCAAIDAARGKE